MTLLTPDEFEILALILHRAPITLAEKLVLEAIIAKLEPPKQGQPPTPAADQEQP